MDDVIFDKKINSEQIISLSTILEIIIGTNFAPLAFVETDDLGVRLFHSVYTVVISDRTPRRTMCHAILLGSYLYVATYRK